MKTIKNLLSVLLALAIMPALHSCGEDEPEYTPATAESGTDNIFISGSASQTVEVEPGITTFSFTVERVESDDAATAELEVLENEDSKFELPTTVSFAAGQTEATVNVNVKSPEEGIYYTLKVRLAGNLSDYTLGTREKSFSFAVMKWEPLKLPEGQHCYWVGNTVSQWFGVGIYPLLVNVEKAETSTFIRFRFVSPYSMCRSNPDADYDGIIGGNDKHIYFEAYPYNEPGDLVSGNTTFVINCPKGDDEEATKLEADLYPTELGIDYGYGMFSCGSIYGHVSSNKDAYPLGVYDMEAGTITFAAGSLYASMANYNGGGKYVTSGPAALYLSDDAYIEALPKDVDYDNDFTWKSVDEATGLFASEAADDKWIQRVEQAEEDATLYRFPSLYAEGANIAFFIDEENQSISMPKGQNSGLTSIGQPLYVNLKSGSFNSKREFTLNLVFYTMDEDGKMAAEIATVTETFKWGNTGVSLADLQRGLPAKTYEGYWEAPFLNASSGNEASTEVLASLTEDGNVKIQGLSGANYDDTVIAEYDGETGLLFLAPQWTADYGEYNVMMVGYNTETPGYYYPGSILVGGVTADGVFAFLNYPGNEEAINTVRYLAVSGGSPAGWLNSWLPYPMEWTAYTGTRSAEAKLEARPSLAPLDAPVVAPKQAKRSFKQTLTSFRDNLWVGGAKPIAK